MFNFNSQTNEDVKRVINSCFNSKQRIRIVYGDTETGRDWLEEHDVLGHIGRSTGTVKTPLLISNSRSMGGGAILTDCIVKIVDVKTKRVLYVNDKYTLPTLVKCASQHSEYMYDVYKNIDGKNELHARFKTEQKADNYIQFMHCKRMAK